MQCPTTIPRQRWMTISLVLVTLLSVRPALGQFTTIVNIPPDPDFGSFQSIGSNTQLNLFDGGSIGNVFRVGELTSGNSNIEVNITGGSVGNSFSVGSAFRNSANVVVNISGGSIGRISGVYDGSIVNISGGIVGSFLAHDGSTVNLSGGLVETFSLAFSGSTVNLSGGSIKSNFGAFSGSVVNLSGGSFGDRFAIESGSTMNLSGSEFRLDGALIGGLNTPGNILAFDLPEGSALSGTLADGTPFALSSLNQDRIAAGTLTLQATSLPPIGPAVITAPGDTIPLGVRSGQTLAVNAGGVVGANFNAGWGSTVEIAGGRVGQNFEAVGATVNISGGLIGKKFNAFNGSGVQLSGGEFRLDDVLIGGLNTPGNTLAFKLPEEAVLSGTLADGTPFAFSSLDLDRFATGTLTLQTVALPPVGPTVITTPNDTIPLGVRDGQTLVVNDGSTIEPDFQAGWGSQIKITGGIVGQNFEAVGATVNITGGSVENGFNALNGSVVNISGGSVEGSFRAANGSTVDITAGTHNGLSALNGSVVNVSGGSLGNLSALNDSVVNVSGGSLGSRFNIESGSSTNIVGSGFRLDGVPIGGLGTPGNTLAFDLPDESVLSGTLADGTPFAFSSLTSEFSSLILDTIAPGTLSLEKAALPPVGQALITVPSDPVPLGVHDGQALLVNDGGVIGANFNAGWGSTVEITGGTVGSNFEAVGALVNISGDSQLDGIVAFIGSTVNIPGGTVSRLQAFQGSQVNISGGSVGFVDVNKGSVVNISSGSVGSFFRANEASTVNISGGSIGSSFMANGSVINFSGGSIGRNFRANSGSVVNFSGGSIGERFRADSSSEIHLFGTQFVLDGVDITASLALDVPFTITDRNVTLEGLLADGSDFSFGQLDSRLGFLIDPNALLTVSLVMPVPEPSAAALLITCGLLLVGQKRRRKRGHSTFPI